MVLPRFDYSSYLDLARELALCGSSHPLSQAKWRSSVSRSYYAAFLHGMHYNSNPEISHRDLIDWLQRQDRDLARDLRSLKTFREDCDYDHPIDYDLSAKAQECVDTAVGIIEGLRARFDAPRS